MKCPSCGYNSFDHLEHCKKCGSPLGRDTQSEETEEKGHRKTRARPGKEFSEHESGDLFLDIPIRDTKPQSRTEARRKRTSGARTETHAESYELFPASKDIEDRLRGGEAEESVLPAAPETSVVPEQVVEVPQPDPFAFTGNDAGAFELEPDGVKEPYGREADVYNLAGFLPRAFALIIDIVLVSLIALLACYAGLFVVYGFDFGSYDSENLFMPIYVTLFLLSSTYFVFFHGYGGMTVGKMIMGIKLINRYGEGIGIWDAFVRWIGYYISGAFLCAGFLWSLVDSECQTWHDKIAGTYVVKD